MSFNLNSLDPTEDWDLFDGRDTRDPLYQHYSSNSYGTAYPVPALFRSGAERSQSSGDSETVISEVRIHIPAASLQAEPHRRDKITRLDEGGDPISYWIVQEVDNQAFTTRYMLTCTEGLE